MADNGHATEKKIVIVYTRVSSDDQNRLSCPDQFKYCGRKLPEIGYANATIVHETDDGISGEHLSRPGIDRVRRLVASGGVALLIGEEVSRFFRDPSEPYKLVGECLDKGTRFVAINDRVDTAQKGWQYDLARASEEHASANEKTSLRIKRAADARWEDGFVMGPLPPGYRRRPIDNDRYALTRRGPLRPQACNILCS